MVGASSDPFFQAMKVGAQAEATAEGAKLIFQGDATTYSPATQIPIFNQVLAQKPSGIALAPTDPTALQNAMTQAKSANVPILNVDSSVSDLGGAVSFITGDNSQGGSVAADTMAKAIGYKAGGSYQVVVGLTSATASTNVARLKGFQDQIAAKYPGIKIVATGYSQSNPTTANTNISNWLTAYPKLNGIFAIDGTNAQGASSALQAKGLDGKVALIGYDAYKTNVDLIKKGVFTALIAQDPAQEGKLAVQTLIKAVKSGTTGIDKAVTLPNIVLDSSTSAADLTKYTYVQTAG
ncbi:D-ribose-binding periplasmic protein [Frondihabitans sp. 762G35]|uniref:substrate-binding domain-containing protein n=1 Tax=Frondihabitans sp. 762G35 TaxID=1446794 RepID=UPI000D20D092|nr:substrate-binding domain-containing protein [Frondihabitans sp. 762G35]ARC58539.1 D-ribose-binding periplasmic protein [Frondihabitans sp. 762G35]